KLCVSCKGCRRECPTGVDMARMKIEVQAARAEKFGLSLHEKLVGYLPRYAPYAAKLPWLFNLRDALPGAAKISEAVAGFSARRSLPKWRRDVFEDDGAASLPSPREAAGKVGANGAGVGGVAGNIAPHPRPLPTAPLRSAGEGEQIAPSSEVVLFADTFNRYFERENLDAALAVLQAGGYRVHLPKAADGSAR